MGLVNMPGGGGGDKKYTFKYAERVKKRKLIFYCKHVIVSHFIVKKKKNVYFYLLSFKKHYRLFPARHTRYLPTNSGENC